MGEIEAAIRTAWAKAYGRAARTPTMVTAVLDGLDHASQARLVHEATALVAMEGGALDNILYAPDGLAVLVLGRDPSAPFPEGCRVNETLSMDPFTHRRLFEALSPVTCTGLVHAKAEGDGARYTADADLVADVLMGLLEDERCRLETGGEGTGRGSAAIDVESAFAPGAQFMAQFAQAPPEHSVRVDGALPAG